MKKKAQATAILCQPMNKCTPGKVTMHPLEEGASLASCIGPESHYLFDKRGIDRAFGPFGPLQPLIQVKFSTYIRMYVCPSPQSQALRDLS